MRMSRPTNASIRRIMLDLSPASSSRPAFGVLERAALGDRQWAEQHHAGDLSGDGTALAEQIGLSVGLILAARHFIGILRLGTPVMLDRWMDRKLFCLITFALSGSVFAEFADSFRAESAAHGGGIRLDAGRSLWCLQSI